jgi:hypothetical protein
MPNFQSVPVPEEHVSAVYALLAQLQGGSIPSTAAVVDESLWPTELVKRAVIESQSPMRDTLVMLAEAGDDGITTEEIAEHFSFDAGRNAVSGMLGAFGRRCQNRYDREDGLYEVTWPQLDDGAYETRLKMKAPYRQPVIDAA